MSKHDQDDKEKKKEKKEKEIHDLEPKKDPQGGGKPVSGVNIGGQTTQPIGPPPT
jgi:hypothetical protein